MPDNTLVFRVDKSFAFTAQIPDRTPVLRGSRCAYCHSPVSYSEQLCKKCRFPLIGPAGFPDIFDWLCFDLWKRHELVLTAFVEKKNYGRTGYQNVLSIPLTEEELRTVEGLEGAEASSFERVHGVSPKKLRDILI